MQKAGCVLHYFQFKLRQVFTVFTSVYNSSLKVLIVKFKSAVAYCTAVEFLLCSCFHAPLSDVIVFFVPPGRRLFF